MLIFADDTNTLNFLNLASLLILYDKNKEMSINTSVSVALSLHSSFMTFPYIQGRRVKHDTDAQHKNWKIQHKYK